VAPGTLSNFSAGTLSGGVWAADGDGGVLRLMGDNITTQAATITVLGANSHIYSDSGTTDALAGLTAISTGYELTIGAGANFTPVAAFRNSGTIQVATGSTLTLSSANSAQIGSLALLGGTLASSTGPLSIAGGLLSGHGTIASSITLGASTTLQLDGFLSGSLVIEGDLVLDGLLQDGIEGNQANAANGYEQLAIRGAFTNNGTINIYPANGFVPGTYDNFQIIQFASRSGTGSITVNGMNVQTFFDGNSVWLLPSSVQTFTVTTTADSGAGSLRNAITQANAAGTFAVIAFDLPTSDSGYDSSTGVWTIALTSALPALINPVLFDAATQPGYAGKPLIVLNGSQAGSGTPIHLWPTPVSGLTTDAHGNPVVVADPGLDIRGGHSTVEGLVIQQFQQYGLVLDGYGGDTVVGNYIGTDASGSVLRGNNGGIVILSGNNTIGGASSAARNVISNGGDSIDISGTAASGNVVEGNFIGTNAAGTASLGSWGA